MTTTTNVTDYHKSPKYHKRLVDYGNRPYVNPNFKWLIACIPVVIFIVLIICLRIRKSRLLPTATQTTQPQFESESENANAHLPPNEAASESQLDVNQGNGIMGPEIRRSGSFGQMLPLWNARSSSLSPTHLLPPPPAYVRYPPDPPKYEDIIGPDDVPLAHYQSRILRQAAG